MVALIMVVFLLRPLTSKRKIKIEPDFRLTLKQDSSCVKLITKSYITGFLNNLFEIIIDFKTFILQLVYITPASPCYLVLKNQINSLIDVTSGFRSCVVGCCCFVLYIRCSG